MEVKQSGKKLCYWTIGNNDYSYMVKTLVTTARNAGVTDDFHVWTDRKIKGAFTHPLLSSEINNYLGKDLYRMEFKLKYLKEMLSFGYDYYIFIDSDSIFVRRPEDPLRLLHGDPMHAFLETDFVENPRLIRSSWWGCPINVLVKTMREMGVKSKRIYNLNAGYFIVHRDYVAEVHELTKKFWHSLNKLGYDTTEEPLLSYAMHLLCQDVENHALKEYHDYYGFYVVPESPFKLPDGKPFQGEEYFTGEKIMVNPAIVHCYYSKIRLMEFSMNYGEKFRFRSRNFLQKIKTRLFGGKSP